MAFMRIANPFYHRGAIRRADDFVGRESPTNQILGLVRNGQSVSLIGPRRIGKSSLLLHLTPEETRTALDPGDQQALFINVDCQELAGSPPEEVYDLLLEELVEAAHQANIEIKDVDQPGTYRALDRVLRQIHQQGTRVVVLLDEFELLAANSHLTPYFFARLRGITTKYELAFLTASQRPLFDITAEQEILSSPFFNIFVTVSLGLFTPSETSDLFDRRLAATGIEFSPELRDHLRSLVGDHPFFLHIAGYHGFQALTADDGPAEEGMSANWYAQLDSAIEIEAESHLGYLWQNLTAEEQHALAIADGPIESLRQLEQQCLLSINNGEYEYTSEILERFVRRQEVPGLIQAGPFVIDAQRHQIWGQGQELSLTTSQFNLLVRLCQDPGQVVRGPHLEMAVWGDVLTDDPDRLKTLIKRLRRAVAPFDNWIVSERGVGYTLRQPDTS